MKNKGRKHKSGNGSFANGNCKGSMCGSARPIRMMSRSDSKKDIPRGVDVDVFKHKAGDGKWFKRKSMKRMRGYFKSQTKEI